LNGTELLGLRLTKTSEVLNTITVGNSLRFPIVHNTAPNEWRFMNYDCQNSTGLLKQKSGQTIPFNISQEFDEITITSTETLNTEFAFNELSFPLVTHMVYSDARFDSYGILKSGQGAELIWTEWTCR
jgi:hypothetical protein